MEAEAEEDEVPGSREEVFEDYALQIFAAAAEEILSAEDAEKFARLRLLLSGPDYELACMLREAGAAEAGDEAATGDIGEGTPLACDFYLQPAAGSLNAPWHVATVFFTEAGMARRLGAVSWFPGLQD